MTLWSRGLARSRDKLSLRKSGAKYVGNIRPSGFQSSSVSFGNMLAKKLSKTYFHILQRAMIWLFNSWEYLFYLNCLHITHFNWWNRRQHFSCWPPCFGFFMCRCYSRRTHYPMQENPSAPNTAACENQGKQRELSDD